MSKTPDEKTHLQALTLITECNKYRIILATSGAIVNDALKCVQTKMDHLDNKQAAKKIEEETTSPTNTNTNTTNHVF